MSNNDDQQHEEISPDGADSPGNPGTYPPVVTSPANGASVGVRPTISGTGHARLNVRVVSPGKEDFLSAEAQVDDNRAFHRPFLQDLKPGRTDYQVLQWKMYPDSHKRSAVMHMYYLPAPLIATPTNGATVGAKPVIGGRNGAPGAVVHVTEAGSGVVTYATATVANDGSWQTTLTVPLPTGRSFKFISIQTLAGHHSAWSNEVSVNVSN
jgi:hypothetical protein